MSTVRLQLQAYHQAQSKIEHEQGRFNVLACGRRFGKDIYEMNKAAEAVIDGKYVGFGAPEYKTLLENWRELNNYTADIVTRRSIQERRLEFATGGVMDFYSLENPDAIRGRKYHRFIINEAGYVPNLMDTWNFIIRPTLVDYKGDAFIGGTPKGRNGFWQMYQWGLDQESPDWKCWQFSSYENPFLPPSELEDMKRRLPDRVFRQEIMAEFIDDAGGVFRRVMDAATAKEQDKPIEGHEYIFGADWARSNDYTVFSVIDLTLKHLVYIDRFSQIDYNVQVSRLKALYERFMPCVIIAEYNSMGGPLVERLQQDGLPVQSFTTTNSTKMQVVDGLALAFERGEIGILNDPVLIGELQAFEGKQLLTGIRYSAPEGMHDDMVMSLALAWSGCGNIITAVTDPFAAW